MGLQEFGHECDRFAAEGMPCPFRLSPEDDDNTPEPLDREDRNKFPQFIPFPLRKFPREIDQEQLERLKRLEQVRTRAISEEEMRKQLERLNSIQQRGGMRSIPRIPDFPLQGRGHLATTSVLSAIALMTIFRMLRSGGFGTGLQAVRVGERHVAQGLSKVARPARSMGRGGLHVNAAADLRRLLFGRRKQRERFGSAGNFDAFSETGFN